MRAPPHPWLPGLVLAVTGLLHAWLEATMARHMLAELPLLFCAGWLAARAGAIGDGARPYRLPMLLAAMLMTSVWMLPVALDLAVNRPAVGLFKLVGVLLSGWLCAAAWPHAGAVLQGFFVLNWAWMTITAGLLYQDAPEQLCSVYLSEQQWLAGTGLVMLGAAVLTLWLAHTAVLSIRADAAHQAG